WLPSRRRRRRLRLPGHRGAHLSQASARGGAMTGASGRPRHDATTVVRAVGLISGTSMDGIDAAAVEIADGVPLRAELRAYPTLQLASPAVIAERTGITVVADFRARDIAAGGRGAPLVPLVDALLYARPGCARALLNLGGIANLTLLPASYDPALVIGFDTGPANMPLDAVMRLTSPGA